MDLKALEPFSQHLWGTTYVYTRDNVTILANATRTGLSRWYICTYQVWVEQTLGNP